MSRATRYWNGRDSYKIRTCEPDGAVKNAHKIVAND